MSTTQTQTSTETCKECGGGIDGDFYTPGYCSEGCYYRHKADSVLTQLRQDHRFCGSCGAQLKAIERPPEEFTRGRTSRTEHALFSGGLHHTVNGQQVLDLTRCDDEPRTTAEAVIGYEYQTENADLVVKTAIEELESDDDYTRILQAGTGCQCGATDHRDTEDALRRAHPARTLVNYLRAFRVLEREGAIQQRLDKATFFETYRDSADFELALGRALYD